MFSLRFFVSRAINEALPTRLTFLHPANISKISSNIDGTRHHQTDSTYDELEFKEFQNNVQDTSSEPSISKAMKIYLKSSSDYENFRRQELNKYEIGKRHLANMMGEDPETFNQDDIDDAIHYLFPSGLYMKQTRPQMKHPLELFPDKKDVEFDISGRPHHHLFYTSIPAYYELLQTISMKAYKLDIEADKIIRAKKEFPQALVTSASQWLPKERLEPILREKVFKVHYEFLIRNLDRFLEHPCSSLEKDFIMKYRVPLDGSEDLKQMEIPKFMYNEKGQPYTTAESWRKTATAHVTITGNGSGNISINKDDILYFSEVPDRLQVYFPLQFTNTWKTVDISATVKGGGKTSQAGALRHAISLALMPFVDEKMIEYMKVAGLIMRDRRTAARKVYGRKGPRAHFTWKKR